MSVRVQGRGSEAPLTAAAKSKSRSFPSIILCFSTAPLILFLTWLTSIYHQSAQSGQRVQTARCVLFARRCVGLIFTQRCSCYSRSISFGCLCIYFGFLLADKESRLHLPLHKFPLFLSKVSSRLPRSHACCGDAIKQRDYRPLKFE